MKRSGLMTALVVLCLAIVASISRADGPSACRSMTGKEVLKAIGALAAGQTVDAIPMTEFIATGSDLQIILDRPYESNKALAFRAVVKPGRAEASDGAKSVADEKAASDNPKAAANVNEPIALLLGPSIALRQIEPDDPRVTAHRVAATATVATLRVPPAPRSLWYDGTIYLLACRQGAEEPEFVTTLTARMSWRWFCAALALAIVLAVYLLSATAVFFVEKLRKGAQALRWYQYLDPVDLTADIDGRGSLSKLQILFFSLIVSGLLSYIVMRTGVLSDLSPTILLLLGISGVGAAASKGTEVGRTRLDFENWAWLIRKRWLPEGGLVTVNRARWRDLVTTEGEFDVYHFQMLVFSLVVGGALLTTGLNNLASFKVPETLLGVLGLSQVVYVGGMLVAPPSYANLNDSLTRLRGLEADFVRVAAISSDPTAAAPQPPMPPADLAAAQRRAANATSADAKTSYAKYKEAAQNARVMFKSLFDRDVADNQIEPSFV